MLIDGAFIWRYNYYWVAQDISIQNGDTSAICDAKVSTTSYPQ